MAGLLLLGLPGRVPAQATPELVDALRTLLGSDATANAFWGVHIIDLEQDAVLYARHSDRSFVPASNMKLYTTASALDQLGPDFQYTTTLYADGTVADSVLHGNLVVRGSGDPSIGGRFADGDRTLIFRQWAHALRAAGIREVRGDVIGDDDVFDDLHLGFGWSWDDTPYWYAAQLGGLVFNDNCVDVSIEGTREGQPGRVTWAPMQTDYVRVVNATRTVAAGGSIDEGYARPAGTNELRLTSRVPEGRTDEESLTVDNPTLFFVHVMRAALVQAGIAVLGNPVDVDDLSIKPDYTHLTQVAVHTSPPLSELVKVVNKRSHNLYADQLLKTLAVHAVPDTAGSHLGGIEAAMHTFAAARIDTSRIRMVDGSGLSYMNLVTPRMTTRLLRHLWAHPNPAVFEAFEASLPIGGVDGSLAGRFREGAAHGNVRAKTGFITGARTLSGYVTTANGRTLAFSLMCNHYTIPTREVNRMQDALVTLLAAYQYPMENQSR